MYQECSKHVPGPVTARRVSQCGRHLEAHATTEYSAQNLDPVDSRLQQLVNMSENESFWCPFECGLRVADLRGRWGRRCASPVRRFSGIRSCSSRWGVIHELLTLWSKNIQQTPHKITREGLTFQGQVVLSGGWPFGHSANHPSIPRCCCKYWFQNCICNSLKASCRSWSKASMTACRKHRIRCSKLAKNFSHFSLSQTSLLFLLLTEECLPCSCNQSNTSVDESRIWLSVAVELVLAVCSASYLRNCSSCAAIILIDLPLDWVWESRSWSNLGLSATTYKDWGIFTSKILPPAVLISLCIESG